MPDMKGRQTQGTGMLAGPAHQEHLSRRNVLPIYPFPGSKERWYRDVTDINSADIQQN